MSDTMLHSILQMPPELWTNDAIDIAQRHRRYLEASKRIIELERERDEARRERDSALKERDAVWNSWSKALDEAREELARVRKELVAANRGAEKNAKVNQGLCTRLAEAERERDEARRECSEAQDGWSRALDERDEARRDLVAAEELHRRRFESLKAELDHVSQMNQHADKSSVGDSTYVLTQQPCQRASRVGMETDWYDDGYRDGRAAALSSGGTIGPKWHADQKQLQGLDANEYIAGFNDALDEYE